MELPEAGLPHLPRLRRGVDVDGVEQSAAAARRHGIAPQTPRTSPHSACVVSLPTIRPAIIRGVTGSLTASLALSMAALILACRPSALLASPGAAPASTLPADVEEAPAEADSAAAGAARPPVATTFELDGSRVVLPAPITFETGSASPDEGASAGLYYLLDYLAAKESVTLVRIEGHGPDQALSEARALMVARWLVANGASCSRLIPVGFGDTKPIADAATPEGRAANARIEAINAGLRGRLIGGLPADGGGLAAGDPCS